MVRPQRKHDTRNFGEPIFRHQIPVHNDYLRRRKTPDHMSDDIRNAGLKGWIFVGFFVFLLLFVMLCVYIYNANYAGLAS